MRHLLITSVFCCAVLQAMNKNHRLLVQRTDQKKIEFFSCDVEQMHRLDRSNRRLPFPVNEDIALRILAFLNAAHAVNNYSISPEYFGVEYAFNEVEPKISLYFLQDHIRTTDNQKEFESNRAKSILLIAREFQATELEVVFISNLVKRDHHHKMVSAILSSAEEMAFMEKMYKIGDKKKEIVNDFNFAQKIFLYGLFERTQLKRKSFIAPLMIGYVQQFMLTTLPKLFNKWAQKKIKKTKKLVARGKLL